MKIYASVCMQCQSMAEPCGLTQQQYTVWHVDGSSLLIILSVG